jgi:hypothetical protein
VAEQPELARNVRLHLGEIDPSQLPASVTALLAPRAVPVAPVRMLQRLAMKRGRLSWQDAWLEPLLRARREVLGEGAAGPPRFLVRVDEFPYYTSFDRPQDLDMSRRFHETMAEAGLAHLMSALPQPSHEPLDPRAQGARPIDEEERALFARMRKDGVVFAQHGNTHRTRHADPRRRSELCGLDPAALDGLLEDGRQRLLAAGVGETEVFVAPFNRFYADQYRLLAKRFKVICGGPESVALLGFHGGPQWRQGSVYVPCYTPLYADAATVFGAAERLIERAPGTWVPIVLHTSWELEDDFQALGRLARLIAPHAVSWEDFLADVSASETAGNDPAATDLRPKAA